MPTPHRSHKGIALVLALAFIVLITVIAVAMSGMMIIERPAANSHFEKMRAAQLAQQGVDNLVAALNQNLSVPSNQSGPYWVSQPGQLVVSAPMNPAAVASPTPNPLQTLVPLCTGAPSATAAASPDYLQPADLNLPSLQDPTSHLITDRATTSADGTTSIVPMKVDWIYLTQDGTPSRTLQATSPAYVWTNNPGYQPDVHTNPIVGRYAYWADDESSKINDNLAWGKSDVGNANPASDPTNVALTALQDASAPAFDVTKDIAQALHGSTTGSRLFNTPKDAYAVSPAAAKALQHYKFEVTHYNHDPGTTVFNEPRIVLTTRPDRAGWTYDANKGAWVGRNGQSGANGLPHYLRILANETVGGGMTPQMPAPLGGNLDPGPLANLDYSGTSANDTINLLVNEMQRQDWPLTSSGAASFKTKYYSAYPAPLDKLRLAQLAINIIDYVRAKESPDRLVPPLRVYATSATSFQLGVGGTSLFMGSARMPFITEIGCGYGGGHVTVYVEIYCPKNYGITNTPAAIPMSTFELRLANTGVFADGTIGASTSAYSDTLSSTSLIPGGYVVVARQLLAGSGFYVPYTPTTFPWSVALSISNGTSPERTDLIPLTSYGDGGIPIANYYLPVPYDPMATTQADAPSIECDDPRINCHTGTWHTPVGVRNTFGTVNTRNTLGQAPTASPQQDADASGLISDASFYMPPPAGATANAMGCVTSVGELGYIHTGIESSTVTYSNPAVVGSPLARLPPGTPWRTLRLQPNAADTSTLPDWALMDLFAAPVIQQNAQTACAPHGTAVGGRVNLNSHASPFDTAPANLGRIYPLAAALQGCATGSGSSTLGPTAAYTLAGNIYNRVLSPPAHGNAGKMYGVPASWPSDGSAPYTSPGEICEVQGIADQGEGSEELVRQAGNLFTVRGNVFTVYAVGQTLKETPGGTLVVSGEQRTQTMIERAERYDPAAQTSTINFRPVYSSDLTP